MYNGVNDACVGAGHIFMKIPAIGFLCAIGWASWMMFPGDSCNGQVVDTKYGTYCVTENPDVDVDSDVTFPSLVAD